MQHPDQIVAVVGQAGDAAGPFVRQRELRPARSNVKRGMPPGLLRIGGAGDSSEQHEAANAAIISDVIECCVRFRM